MIGLLLLAAASTAPLDRVVSTCEESRRTTYGKLVWDISRPLNPADRAVYEEGRRMLLIGQGFREGPSLDSAVALCNALDNELIRGMMAGVVERGPRATRVEQKQK